MKRVAALWMVAAILVGSSARAETGVPDLGVETSVDVGVDTSLGDVSGETADAGDAMAEVEDAVPETPADTTVADTMEAAVDTAPAMDTAPATDTAPALDTAPAVDTGRAPGPGTTTENPNDHLFRATETGDGCTCRTPHGTNDAGALAALLGLLVVLTRRQSR
jgi:hypothetical protein